jgi:hypothetical protein
MDNLNVASRQFTVQLPVASSVFDPLPIKVNAAVAYRKPLIVLKLLCKPSSSSALFSQHYFKFRRLFAFGGIPRTFGKVTSHRNG